jgi:hypothetical protein
MLKDFGFFFKEDFFEGYIFAMVKYLNFHNSSFALRYFFNVNDKIQIRKRWGLLAGLGRISTHFGYHGKIPKIHLNYF